MRYFIDTEYDWRPGEGCIVPISVALVAEDGREYYAVTTSFVPSECSSFVQEHVIPVLPWSPQKEIQKLRGRITEDILGFVGSDIPEFWGDYSAFDYVVLSMLMGEFSDWPDGWPMHVNDLQQDAIPSVESAVPHNALSDARSVRDAYTWAFQALERVPPGAEP